MVLRCECGGELKITHQNYTDRGGYERYRCIACGRFGGYNLDNNDTAGCVTIQELKE